MSCKREANPQGPDHNDKLPQDVAGLNDYVSTKSSRSDLVIWGEALIMLHHRLSGIAWVKVLSGPFTEHLIGAPAKPWQ